MEEILKEIQTKISTDTRNPYEMHNYLKQLGMYMFTTNTIGKENVVSFCSTMINLYLKLTKKEE